MGTEAFVLGVDGGGTKTIALVAQRDGTIVGTGRAGCSNLYTTDTPEHALATVTTAVEQALGCGRGSAWGARGGRLQLGRRGLA